MPPLPSERWRLEGARVAGPRGAQGGECPGPFRVVGSEAVERDGREMARERTQRIDEGPGLDASDRVNSQEAMERSRSQLRIRLADDRPAVPRSRVDADGGVGRCAQLRGGALLGEVGRRRGWVRRSRSRPWPGRGPCRPCRKCCLPRPGVSFWNS